MPESLFGTSVDAAFAPIAQRSDSTPSALGSPTSLPGPVPMTSDRISPSTPAPRSAPATTAKANVPAPGPTLARFARARSAAIAALTSAVVKLGVWSANAAGRVVHSAMPADQRTAAKTTIPAILDSASHFGIADANQTAYMLATAQLESKDGAGMREDGNGDRRGVFGHDSYFDRYEPGTATGARLGNTVAGDGEKYCGRGFVQITGRANYEAIGAALHLPKRALVEHPEKLERDTSLAADAMSVGLSRPGGFTGAGNLDALIPAGRTPGSADFYHARAAVTAIKAVPATIVADEAKAIAPIVARYEAFLGEGPR